MISSEDRLSVRPMDMGDIPQVAEIEREAFPEPWPAVDFKRELTFNRSTCYLVAYSEPVENNALDLDAKVWNGNAQLSGSKFENFIDSLKGLFGGNQATTSQPQLILGYAGIWFLVDEAHLSSIAVRETCQGNGVGELLFSKCVEIAWERNAQCITLEVRASNKKAQALYEKYGLAEVGIRRGYYTDNKEDAIIMTADRAAFQSNFRRLKQAYVQKWGLDLRESL